MEKGLEILAKVKRELGVPVLTDVHREDEIEAAAAVVDVLQTPAFLCRQTDFIRAVAQAGKPVNIKKGQFLAPHDMKNVVDKARAAARDKGRPEDSFMASSAASASATTTSSPTCARSPSCARRAARSSSMRRTRCSCPADRALHRAASASSCRCWRARRSRSASPACSWKPTRIRPKAMSDGPNAVPLARMKAAARALVELDRVVKNRSGFLERRFSHGSANGFAMTLVRMNPFCVFNFD